MEKQKPKKALGKGLSALINASTVSPSATNTNEVAKDKSGIIEVDINNIEPNKVQPRQFFDEDKLQELAESIINFGIIQPLIVQDRGDYYSIIAGERRWRAARIAKLKTIPVIIKEYNEMETIEIALIENIQREDLNPIEEALCYQRLSEEYFLSQTDIAKKLGRNRTGISNCLNLLKLDNRVQLFLSEGKLSPGHGRILLAIEDNEAQFLIAENTIKEIFSIRQLESYIKHIQESKESHIIQKSEVIATSLSDIDERLVLYRKLERDLKDILGTKVTIKKGKKKGKIEIEYYSDEELDRLIGLIKSES